MKHRVRGGTLGEIERRRIPCWWIHRGLKGRDTKMANHFNQCNCRYFAQFKACRLSSHYEYGVATCKDTLKQVAATAKHLPLAIWRLLKYAFVSLDVKGV